MTGCLFLIILMKLLGNKGTGIAALILYVIGLFGDSYYGMIEEIPVLKSVYDGIFTVSSYTRNGIFYVSIFFGMGMAYTAASRRKIAVLSIGYADGIPREIAGKAYVLCRGKKVAVIGRICMDQMLVDVTDIPDIISGDEVVLIGRSEKEQIPAEAYAEWTDSISNEVVSRLGLRLERIACT